jgi:hypothetical protein
MGRGGVGTETPGVHDEPQPGLLDEIFGHVPTVGQPRKKVKQAAVEGIVHGIERLWIASPQAFNKLELQRAVHRGTNAEIDET